MHHLLLHVEIWRLYCIFRSTGFTKSPALYLFKPFLRHNNSNIYLLTPLKTAEYLSDSLIECILLKLFPEFLKRNNAYRTFSFWHTCIHVLAKFDILVQKSAKNFNFLSNVQLEMLLSVWKGIENIYKIYFIYKGCCFEK